MESLWLLRANAGAQPESDAGRPAGRVAAVDVERATVSSLAWQTNRTGKQTNLWPDSCDQIQSEKKRRNEFGGFVETDVLFHTAQDPHWLSSPSIQPAKLPPRKASQRFP